MLVKKKGTDDLYAMKSLRKQDIIQKDQIEHTKTERKVLENVITLTKKMHRQCLLKIIDKSSVFS